MALTYPTAEPTVASKRGSGVEGALNALGNAFDELEVHIAALESELHPVCRPPSPACGSEMCEERSIQSPVKDSIDMYVRRVKYLRDAVASIRTNLDL